MIAYVHELAEFSGTSIPYQMHLGRSVAVLRFDALFDSKVLAHEVGHVLGAGHPLPWLGNTNSELLDCTLETRDEYFDQRSEI